jgi:hypothetical protein
MSALSTVHTCISIFFCEEDDVAYCTSLHQVLETRCVQQGQGLQTFRGFFIMLRRGAATELRAGQGSPLRIGGPASAHKSVQTFSCVMATLSHLKTWMILHNITEADRKKIFESGYLHTLLSVYRQCFTCEIF